MELMGNIYNNHVNNGHARQGAPMAVGQTINTKYGPARIVDIQRPHSATLAYVPNDPILVTIQTINYPVMVLQLKLAPDCLLQGPSGQLSVNAESRDNL
jgi:hypothetical protein